MQTFHLYAPPKGSLRVHTQVEESRQRQGAAQQDTDVSETQVLEQRAGPLEGPGQGGSLSVLRLVCGASGASAWPHNRTGVPGRRGWEVASA